MITKIYVLSKGKPETALVYKWLKEHKFKDYVTIVSNDDDLAAYHKNYGGTVVRAPKSCDNVSKKKEFIVRTYAKKGEWVFMVCDNLTLVTGVKNEKDLTRAGFAHKISPQELLKVVNADIKIADKEGCVLGGYASNDNHFFRQKKYRTVGFVWGKMFYVKHSDMKWDHSQRHKDDYVLTATSLEHSGKVLINNYFYSYSKRFEAIGGEGSYDKRAKGFVEATKYLIKEFGEMFRIVDRKGLEKNSEVRMCFTNEKQVTAWRMSRRKSVGFIRS